MNEPLWIRVYRVAFALLAIVALIAKYPRDDDPWHVFFSKFSYQTNAYAALILLGGAFLAPGVIRSVRWDLLRGAAVMYLITTFIVYGFIVNSFDNPFDTTRHWTHTVVHQVMPVAMVLDLLMRPFANRLQWRDAVRWTVYPIAYLLWSMARGQLDGWYPYDFIDPDEVGWGGVVTYTIGITAGFLALGLLVVAVSHWRRRGAGSDQERSARYRVA